jgi:sirohydrochlorin cobaltochelatase
MTAGFQTGDSKCAIILFGHGSRDTQWHVPIQAVAQRIRATSPSTTVACAFLELTEPSLAAASSVLIEAGVRQIKVLPMFLGVGRHAREDLPALVVALQLRYPDVIFNVAAAVGENAEVLDLLANIALK